MKTAYKTMATFGLALLVSQGANPAFALDVPAPSAAAIPMPMPGADSDDKTAKGLSAAEDKAIDQTKSVIRRLNSVDSMTLDDLNAAHQAAAKIDALIDIEKRLNELEKLRADRDGGSGAMSASALMPPPMPAVVPVSAASVAPPPAAVFSPSVSISRITGSDGVYRAVLKMPDGNTKTVQTGDHVPEVGTILAITSSGVETEQNNHRHVIKVENVQTVFGSTN